MLSGVALASRTGGADTQARSEVDAYDDGMSSGGGRNC